MQQLTHAASRQGIGAHVDQNLMRNKSNVMQNKVVHQFTLSVTFIGLLFIWLFVSSERAGAEEGVRTTNPLWVKICSDEAAQQAANQPAQKVCLMALHERLDRQTGMVLVSVAIRKLDSEESKRLLIMVPLGMAIAPGLRLKFDKDNKELTIPYTACHFAGCVAEVDASEKLIEKFKAGRTVTVMAVDQRGKPLLFPVPLKGFTAAYKGDALAMSKYSQDRAKLIKQLRQPLFARTTPPASAN